MRPKNISAFYNTKDRLAYHPKVLFAAKRTGIKRLIAFDDRFEEVTKLLSDLIGKYPGKIKVLDIGVGDAVYESMLPENISKKCLFFGVDISQKQIARAKKYLHEGKVVDINSEKLPYPKNFFDVVIISEILEHLFFPDKLLADADRVLKPAGYILLTYPNSGALQLRLTMIFSGRSVMLNYPENKQHIRFFQTKDILLMLGKDYQVIKEQGLSSFLFDKWNFYTKIPMPRILEIFGNKILPNLALGNLLLVRKIK